MNSITILGRLCDNITCKYLPSGEAMARFSIAWNKRKKDKTSQAHFFKCVSFGRGAELAEQYFKKGDRMLISGELSQNSYTDKQGNKRESVEILVKSIVIIENNKINAKETQHISQNPPIAQIDLDKIDEVPF